ncbi:hypothetical protein SAMN02745248_00599 [Hathewaya proteolytica DSM 3090]|uniref:Uncharacterized protein n=1 Tax=Hathewaya proteolytica DSM 3090 TaxID=1121331 RepID=A0A1M6L2T1_9CLOT|nr:hypothetical protein [Hathewaya proteolytica]SHJ65444.1 hypothetical protein SAMN02745248_00599 [Hathewaya proteolytica DSM 3090]
MNIYELHNLKEWAEIIGKEYKDSTNSRKALVSELECYGKFEKVGRKYQFTELYDVKKEKVDNRINNGQNENSHKHSTTDYADLQYILLDYLYKQQNKSILYLTNNLLATKLLTSDNYNFCRKNEEYFILYLKGIKALENSIVVKDLFSNVNSNVKGIMATALKNLNEKYGLIYEYGYVINYLDYNDKGQVVTLTRAVTEAESEAEVIKVAIEKFIQKFNIKHEKMLSKRKSIKILKSVNDAFSLSEKYQKEFWEDLNFDICCALYDNFKVEVELCYNAYTIHHHTLDFVKCEEILNDKNIDDMQVQMKEKFINNRIKSVQKKIKIMDMFIEEKIKTCDVWGIMNETHIQSVLYANYGSSSIIYEKFYLEQYTNILNLLILNQNNTSKEIKDIFGSVTAVKAKIQAKRNAKEQVKS